jgi:TonB family protein
VFARGSNRALLCGPLNFTVRQPAMQKAALRSALLLSAIAAVLTNGCASGYPQQTHDPHRLPNTLDYYPDKARRQGLTGRVGLEFSCDEKGRARNIAVVDSGGPLFDAAAKQLMSDSRCTPGNPPETRGRVGVIFQISGMPKVQPFEDNRPTVVVTAGTIPGGG